MEASIRTRQIGPATYWIALRRGIRHVHRPRVQARPASCIQRGAEEAIVDLSAVTFIDSTFLGILLGGLRSLRERGGVISIVCPDSIRRIFEITGLDRVPTIAEVPAVAVETCDLTTI